MSHIIPGSILGQITARVVRSAAIITSLTSNSGTEASSRFTNMIRARVGAHYVIAGMDCTGGRVVGYEANAGFIFGFDATITGLLPRMMTDDRLLPFVASAKIQPLSSPIAPEPPRVTAADRIAAVTCDCSAAVITQFTTAGSAASELLAARNQVPIVQATIDALRITCASRNVIHLRPSGNATQLKVYLEADHLSRAKLLLDVAIVAAEKRLSCTATFTHRGYQ